MQTPFPQRQLLSASVFHVKGEKWLHRRVMCEVFFRMLEGLAFMTIGLATLLVTSFFSAFALFILLSRVGAFLDILGVQPNLSWLGICMFLLVLLLSFHGAYKNRWGMDYSGVNVHWGMPVSGDLLKGMTTLVCDVLFSGPRLLFAGCDSFGKSLRLLHLDIPQIAAIVLWLMERGTKATVEEVASNFPRINAVRILPQLRDIPGVIWLPKLHGVILLSVEFRTALAGVIFSNAGFQEAETVSSEEDSSRSEQDRIQHAEMVGWYETFVEWVGAERWM